MSASAVLIGQAIGDALGRPFEFKKASDEALQRWNGEYLDGGWDLKAGQYTDDTKMAIGLARALRKVTRGFEFDRGRAMSEYLAWYETKDLRGIGSTVQRALLASKKAGKPVGVRGKMAAGNGTVMRAGVIGVRAAALGWSSIETMNVAFWDACATHVNPEAMTCSFVLAHLIHDILASPHIDVDIDVDIGVHMFKAISFAQRGLEFAMEFKVDGEAIGGYDTVRNVIDQLRKAETLLLGEADPKKAILELGTGYYCTETLAASVYAFCATTSFEDAVRLAISGGDDADTTGAVTGALAGAYYGLRGIPAKYLHGVEDKTELLALEQELYGVEG